MIQRFTLIRAALGVAGLFTANISHAAFPWSMAYSVNDSQPPPFESGVIFPAVTGFALEANSTRTNVTGQYPIPSLARFDASGNQFWAVYMDAGPNAQDRELQPAQSDLEYFFAGYIDEASPSARFGILKGTDPSMKRYAYQMPLTPAETAQDGSVTFSLESGDRATILRNLGTTIRALVVSSNGATLVDRQYSSPRFTVSQAPLFIQNVYLDRVPGLDRYLLSVVIQRQFVDVTQFPPLIGYSNAVIAAQLNSDGSMRWARQFDVVTGTSFPPLRGLSASGEVVYVFADIRFNLLTGAQSTSSHVVKLSADGSVDWGKTVSGIQLLAPRFSNQGIWISGSKTVSTTPMQVDAVLIRLDTATGNLLAQATLNKGSSDGIGIAGFSQNKIFFAMGSFDINAGNFMNQTGMIASADLSLQNFTFRQYVKANTLFGPLFYDSVSSCLIYSPIVANANAVGVIALNTDLVPLADCSLFAPTTVQVQNTGLSTANLTVTTTDPMLTASAVTSTLNATTLNISPLMLNPVDICETMGDCPRPRVLIRRIPSDGSLVLEFPSNAGCTYNIQRTAALRQSPFQTVQTLSGNGGTLTHNLGRPDGNAFFRVEVTSVTSATP